jgi:hypothetical protein
MRWLYVFLCIVVAGLDLAWPEDVLKHGTLGIVLSVGATILDLFAAYLLLRKDSWRWFATGGTGDVNPNIFA